jgi:malate synthase
MRLPIPDKDEDNNMTTLASNHSTTTPSQTAWMATELNVINQLNARHVQQIIDYSKGFLDKTFPLAQGSHQEVVCYMVYFQHLLAFFADGRKSGLQHPAQFVALSGHREAPESLVLVNQGRHVELILNRHGSNGEKDCAGIDDIQLQAKHASEPWFSMLSGKQLIKGCGSEKRFTAKDGSAYLASCHG